MNPDRMQAILRHLETQSDWEIAAATFPSEGLHVRASESAEIRYVGATRLPPGPPPGLHRRDDGSYELKNVAIVRVQPQTALLAAQRIVRKTRIQSAIIGVVGGIATLILVAGLAHFREQRTRAFATPDAPCLIAGISNSTVLCRVGAKTLPITLGKFFPDGRYLLAAVNEAQNGFTATRITDRQSVVFQLDLNSSTTGAPLK